MRYLLLAATLLVMTASAQTTDFNPFQNEGAGATVPATRVLSVEPNDGCNQIPQPNRAVWVGGDGAIRVKTYGGDVVTISGIQAGSLLPISIQCVYSTGTSATLIQVWW